MHIIIVIFFLVKKASSRLSLYWPWIWWFACISFLPRPLDSLLWQLVMNVQLCLKVEN